MIHSFSIQQEFRQFSCQTFAKLGVFAMHTATLNIRIKNKLSNQKLTISRLPGTPNQLRIIEN